jgi:bacillithiol synthase
MAIHSLDLRTTGQFPALLLDYLDQKPSLSDFYNVYPTLENAQEIINQRAQFPLENRLTLVKTLEKQYEGLTEIPDFSTLLDERTFTVTTGHQLNIFTGPLYIIYKIVTTINLSRALQQQHPQYRFVPVYWMASEDHDFAEIASVHILGQTLRWEGAHQGAVGRLDPKELKSLLKYVPENPTIFSEAYLQNDTLSDAVRCYMHSLFGKEGLICLDADNSDLKRLFLPVIKDELKYGKSGEMVDQATQKLKTAGYHTPLNAREINLFYMEGDIRERIVRDGQNFKVLNTEKSFSEDEILNLADRCPEYFSPNVVLRPLYEEVILPNLAYIGGPSEIPYWMQLKGIFDHYKVPFPMLVPRNFALYVNAAQHRKLNKLGMGFQELFLDDVSLRRLYVQKHTENPLDLSEEKNTFSEIVASIADKALAIDVTLDGAVKAQRTHLVKLFEHLEKKIKKAEERKHSEEIQQLLCLKNKLFPGGVAQERYDNLLSLYSANPLFIQSLFEVFDPLDFKYNVLVEN